MFYRVKAKCGHVGRNCYVEKYFYVKAASGKEAAKKVRDFPRVKHHHKDAILSVERISYDEYMQGVESSSADSYFHVKNSSEQRLLGAVDPKEIQKESQRAIFKRTRNVEYIMKRRKILEREYDKMLSEAIYG